MSTTAPVYDGAPGEPEGAGSSPTQTPEKPIRAVTWRGVWTVAVLELRQRVRSTRWKVALASWFVVVGIVAMLLTASLTSVFVVGEELAHSSSQIGPTLFGLIVFFVLFLGLLVSPTLSATAINGDRASGTLAILQVTMLSAAEIVLGKLLAAWIAAAVFLVVSTPFLIWALTAGGTPVITAIGTLVLLAVLLAVVCAIGLGFSAWSTRTSGSAVLTYLTVAGLAVGTLIAFGLTATLFMRNSEVRFYDYPDEYYMQMDPDKAAPEGGWKCEWRTEQQPVFESQRVWWLLAINPFVIVADLTEPDVSSGNPLAVISSSVREARDGPQREFDWCPTSGGYYQPWYGAEPMDRGAPIWPWGLAVHLAVGTGSVLFAIKRLRLPVRTLPRGTRVA